MASCFGESSSCESQPEAVDGQDLGHIRGSSRRLDGKDVAWLACAVAAKDLHHRHGPRYTILFIFFVEAFLFIGFHALTDTSDIYSGAVNSAVIAFCILALDRAINAKQDKEFKAMYK